MNEQMMQLILGGLLALPGLYALYLGLHRDLQDTNMRLQLESYANEIKRLQLKTDDQQRKLNDMTLDVINLRATQKVLIENMKRLAMQVKQGGDEPVVDVDSLMQMLS